MGSAAKIVRSLTKPERDFFIDNLLVRIHFIIVMIWWNGLASWEFEFLFSDSLIFTYLKSHQLSQLP
jgi:hypothetical protein